MARRVSQGSFGDVSADVRPTTTKTVGSDGSGRVSNRGAALAAPRPESADGVRGRVVTSDQQAIAGASVAISAGPPHPDIAAFTDDDGRFSLDSLSPGQYELTVNKSGYQSRSVQFESPVGRSITVVLGKAG